MPIGFASEAWPRPGLAEPRSASLAGFGFFHQHIRKGKVVITKTSKEKRLLLGSFLAPETDMIFGDGVGASPVVDDPAAFTREMTRILRDKHTHPLIAQMMKPAESSEPPSATASASGASTSRDLRTTPHEQFQ